MSFLQSLSQLRPVCMARAPSASMSWATALSSSPTSLCWFRMDASVASSLRPAAAGRACPALRPGWGGSRTPGRRPGGSQPARPPPGASGGRSSRCSPPRNSPRSSSCGWVLRSPVPCGYSRRARSCARSPAVAGSGRCLSFIGCPPFPGHHSAVRGIKPAWWARRSGPLAAVPSAAGGQRRVVLRQRALGRALLVGEPEAAAQLDTALPHRADLVLAGPALPVEGAEERLLAADEGLAALLRQADALQVVGHRVLPRQAIAVELLVREQAQVTVGHGHHQVGDCERDAVALQVLADLAVDGLQLLLELGARGRRRTDPDHAVDAYVAGDHAHVAGGQQQDAGAVAHRPLAHPQGPAGLADDVAGPDRLLDLPAAGI